MKLYQPFRVWRRAPQWPAETQSSCGFAKCRAATEDIAVPRRYFYLSWMPNNPESFTLLVETNFTALISDS